MALERGYAALHGAGMDKPQLIGAGSGTGAFADGTGAAASFLYPIGVAVSPDGATLFVGGSGNNRVRATYWARKITNRNGERARPLPHLQEKKSFYQYYFNFIIVMFFYLCWAYFL